MTDLKTRTIAARTENLTKVYGKDDAEVHALDGVSIDIYDGEFTAIMGPSGSGKSTLMHCMAALDVATSGDVFIGERGLSTMGDKALTQLRRDSVGFVFQAYNLVPTLTAEENILLPLSIAGRKPDREWFDTVIDTVGLRDRLGHRPNELSGGQQQRVACARALMSRPSIVFADEPTGNLDSKTSVEVMAIFQELNDEGKTVVLITHEPDISEHAKRVVMFRDGRILSDVPVTKRRVVARVARAANAGGPS